MHHTSTFPVVSPDHKLLPHKAGQCFCCTLFIILRNKYRKAALFCYGFQKSLIGSTLFLIPFFNLILFYLILTSSVFTFWGVCLALEISPHNPGASYEHLHFHPPLPPDEPQSQSLLILPPGAVFCPPDLYSYLPGTEL